MDLATIKHFHELAAGYGGAGLEQDENNLRCPFCIESEITYAGDVGYA
jgi:hypothetical protein